MTTQREQGVVVQFTEGVVRHFPGKDGLADAIAYADAHNLKVCVFSTPETILRDLQHDRANESAEVGTKYPKHGDLPLYDAPEDRILRTLGRLDLYARPIPRRRHWPLRFRVLRRRPDYPRR